LPDGMSQETVGSLVVEAGESRLLSDVRPVTIICLVVLTKRDVRFEVYMVSMSRVQHLLKRQVSY
jgi:hypothetical protein